ncbi:hypothetical protein A5756_11145 [Mycobacterium sp. 852002-53434_SCH5985345]|nr:hypothetical protein A5756_11145 [Mycobacterium sp. 852002-53434_SCH5985345]OBF76758.1 hypothetical protein A5750_07660 [Mycobacterium sp. 852002-51613_SCH5001154]OBF96899.1 hypothetical protein A5773_11245 [Mycobacterium sp. 852014-52450_SCH5900713]
MDVVLMGVASVVEPVCPVMHEAAAIVEAEWVRLRRESEPARHPSCEFPTARRCRRQTSTLVSTESTRAGRAAHTLGRRTRWPASLIWARQRSPPACRHVSRIGEGR